MGAFLRCDVLAVGRDRRRVPHRLRLRGASGDDTLQGQPAQHRPGDPLGQEPGFSRPRFLLDPECRRFRFDAHLSRPLRRSPPSWPQLSINVINKGVGGEMAFQMLARLERDVLPYHPQLVIWQTGSNHVLRSMDIDGYASMVREAISRLKAAQIDVGGRARDPRSPAARACASCEQIKSVHYSI